MLKTRILTAIVITAIALLALFLAEATAFSLLVAMVLPGLGGWEGARLAGVTAAPARLLFAAGLLAAALAIEFGLLDGGGLVSLLVPACLVWLGLFAWLARPELGRSTRAVIVAIKLAVVAVILLAAWLALSHLQAVSAWSVVLLLFIIAAADVGAYFTGRAVGGSKLAPAISPGKTRSGAIGGLMGAMVVATLVAALIPESPFNAIQAGVLALPLALASIGGDLFISLLKRQQSLKDTSALLPGHGGILDRLDSLAAALPFFAVAVALWGQ